MSWLVIYFSYCIAAINSNLFYQDLYVLVSISSHYILCSLSYLYSTNHHALTSFSLSCPFITIREIYVLNWVIYLMDWQILNLMDWSILMLMLLICYMDDQVSGQLFRMIFLFMIISFIHLQLIIWVVSCLLLMVQDKNIY